MFYEHNNKIRMYSHLKITHRESHVLTFSKTNYNAVTQILMNLFLSNKEQY